eukprot:CAMPEP_0116850312 /NCGR_PEP_ID=MMETSP0418-20121206/16086_1 /TAXON_ID=1158023 /ORGANISM="Astrosyne radiata, Strain 13vi08-1A" /LENGTH=206 /DNA_ID=CAMNT_0004482187 /DNA_START=40 /DNA_END=660 /DNA_ORIENTATION=-
MKHLPFSKFGSPLRSISKKSSSSSPQLTTTKKSKSRPGLGRSQSVSKTVALGCDECGPNKRRQKVMRRRRHSTGEIDDVARTAVSAVSELEKQKRSVSFGNVYIRQHERILGNHPACGDPLALGIGWKHSGRTTVMGVDTFEQKRQKKRQVSMQKLNYYERRMLLRVVGGIQEKELREACANYVPPLEEDSEELFSIQAKAAPPAA